jgi:hypothetical protein
VPPLTACPNPLSPHCPNLPPHERAHHQIQFGGEICLARGRSLWMSAYHKQATSRQSRQVPAQYRSQAPPHLIPHHGVAHRLAHYETDQRSLGLIAAMDQQMTGQQPVPGAATATHRELELSAAAHPGFCGKQARPPPSRRAAQSGGGRSAGAGAQRGSGKQPARGREEQGHTLTLARPFRRRAASTARPALVRMRSRNPCVLARRRLFGWNVRLLTGGSTYGVITGSRAARRASAQRTAQGKAFESVHVTRITKHRSNQGHPRQPDGLIITVGRNGRLPNAARPASLGCG